MSALFFALRNLRAVIHIATDTAHHIVYDNVPGARWFDADGDGAGAAIQFAALAARLALTNNDFIVGG